MQSGNERSGRSSRLGSLSSLSSEAPIARTKATAENGEIDFKKLYEESQAENEQLRQKLRRTEDELTQTRSQLDKAQGSTQSKSILSEAEKRERRAMERKLSEMEEELKVGVFVVFFFFIDD